MGECCVCSIILKPLPRTAGLVDPNLIKAAKIGDKMEGNNPEERDDLGREKMNGFKFV